MRRSLSGDPLAPELERFIRQSVDSVEQLEMLVLMRLQQPRRWTAAELALEMRTSEGGAKMRLGGLVDRGLVKRAGEEYAYEPVDPKADALVAAVASAYLTKRFVVIDVIVGNPTEKIQVFADAFRLRKRSSDDEGGSR